MLRSFSKDSYPENPSIGLQEAALIGSTVCIEILLKDRNTDLNYRDRVGSTALMYAAAAGDENIVRMLIENKANINLYNNYHQNALTHAIDKKRTKVVGLLLEKKATIELESNPYQNATPPLGLAKRNGYQDIVEMLETDIYRSQADTFCFGLYQALKHFSQDYLYGPQMLILIFSFLRPTHLTTRPTLSKVQLSSPIQKHVNQTKVVDTKAISVTPKEKWEPYKKLDEEKYNKLNSNRITTTVTLLSKHHLKKTESRPRKPLSRKQFNTRAEKLFEKAKVMGKNVRSQKVEIIQKSPPLSYGKGHLRS